jgi:hypothetical protein
MNQMGESKFKEHEVLGPTCGHEILRLLRKHSARSSWHSCDRHSSIGRR